MFARSVGSGCPNRSRLCEGECGQWLRWKKSLRHEPVKTKPGEENGPGSEEAPVRSGRCPPFQGRIFPPSSPGEKVAPLNRSVAAKNGWCGLAVVVVDRWHSALGPLKMAPNVGPAGSRWGPVTFRSWSLVAHKIPAAPAAPYIARRLPLCGCCLAPSSTTSCMYPLTCQLSQSSPSPSPSPRDRRCPSCRLVHYPRATLPTRPPAFNARRQPDGPDLLNPRPPIPGRLYVDDVLPRLV